MSESSTESAILSQGEPFWRQHVLTAQSFRGTDVEYCRRNGLSPTTFSAYKVKLGFSKHKKREAPPAFVKVEPKTAVSGSVLQSAQAAPKNSRALPDAKWTAEFVSALFGQK